jgi:hypothetical protein
VERVDLLLAVLGAAAATGGRVQGTELGETLLLGRQGGLQGIGQLGVVHGDDPQAGLQLEDLNFSSGEF